MNERVAPAPRSDLREDATPVPRTIGDWALPRLPYRSVAGDVGTSVLVAVVGVVVVVTGFGAGAGAYPDGSAIPIAATLGASVALLGKRRHPLLVVLSVAAMVAVEFAHADRINLALGYAAADALYAAAFVGTRAQRRAVVAVCLAIALVVTVSVSATFIERLELLVSLVLFLGAPLFVGTAIRQGDALVRAERARREAEAARADAVGRAAVAERQRAVQVERATLARDLHDGVAAHLSAIALQAGAAAGRDDASPTMRAVRSSSLAALTELRQLMEVLSGDGSGSEVPLRVPPGIDETAILEADARRSGVRLHLDVDLPPGTLTRATSHVLMRIAREVIVNAARHAPGVPVHLEVHPEGDTVALCGTNLLVAADPADASDQLPSGGLGTVIMVEQAAAVGGHCAAGPDADGRRWVVRAVVPRQRQAVDA